MDKVNIVHHLLCNVNADEIAERFGTTIQKIFIIRENHQTIMEVYKYYLLSQEFKLRAGHYPRMENILYAWFNDQKKNVTNKELGTRGRVIVNVLNEQSSAKNAFPFTGSNNWVNAFKTRYDINKKSSPTNMNWELGSSSGISNLSSDSSMKLHTPKAEPEDFQCSDTDDSIVGNPDISGSVLEDEFDAEAHQVKVSVVYGDWKLKFVDQFA